ncbi:MAG TPA: hypothetical protein VMW25_00050 [Clostridia bacterium]|nr:hypothetical protein [Clostridia bacterium]
MMKKIKTMQLEARRVSERIKAMTRKERKEPISIRPKPLTKTPLAPLREPVSSTSPKLLKELEKRVEERRREEKLKPKEPKVPGRLIPLSKKRLPLPKWREIPLWKWRGEPEWVDGFGTPKRGTSRIHKGPYVGPRARKKKYPPKTI